MRHHDTLTTYRRILACCALVALLATGLYVVAALHSTATHTTSRP